MTSARHEQGARPVRAGATTAFALGLLALIATGSILAGAVMLLASGACVVAVMAWVARRERRYAAIPDGALWVGQATVRVLDLLECPLLDTVTVSRPGAARRHPERGAAGQVVVNDDGLTWAATLAANLGGVYGSFALPWTAIVNGQVAALPSATPGSGAIGLAFADRTKLDIAFSGNYRGFRASLTRLRRPVPGLAD